jgi:hypothetical protein
MDGPGGEFRPGRKVSGGGEHRHVDADLGDDRLGGGAPDAGDLFEPLQQRHSGTCQFAVLGVAGDPEIDQFRAVRRQQDVRGLHIPVHQPGGVDPDQRLGHAGAQNGHHVQRQRPAGASAQGVQAGVGRGDGTGVGGAGGMPVTSEDAITGLGENDAAVDQPAENRRCQVLHLLGGDVDVDDRLEPLAH